MIAGLDRGCASLDSVDPSVECVPALPAIAQAEEMHVGRQAGGPCRRRETQGIREMSSS